MEIVIAYKQFARFKSGNFNVEDGECSNRPSDRNNEDNNLIEMLIENNPGHTMGIYLSYEQCKAFGNTFQM